LRSGAGLVLTASASRSSGGKSVRSPSDDLRSMANSFSSSSSWSSTVK
jgi:hypothetical protein